jgi:CheY-like chemotaxis protein
MNIANKFVMGDLSLLVVDDDDLVAWALEKAAAPCCADVCIAGTGSAALARVRSARYDLAFVDIHLPDTNGLDLLLQIRDLSPATKIVMLSSDATPTNRECAFARGAWQFIEKPFELAEIAQVLGDCSAPVEERRRGKRTLCRLPLRIDVIPPADDRMFAPPCSFEATATDLSDGGLRIHTAFELRPGQLVRLHATKSDDPSVTMLGTTREAQVVWVAPGTQFRLVGLVYRPDRRS